MKNAEKTKVALVEDNCGLRDSLEQLISTAADMHIVGSFVDGESALEGLPGAAADVVLVDINLPGMSGIDLISLAKAAMPHVQFLVLTVYDDPARIFQALAAGANGYLLKRVTPADLLSAIRDLHSGGSPMSGSVARKVVQSFHRMGVSQDETENLSPRETEILELLSDGYLYKEIAERLAISIETVRTYIRRIYDKLHVRTRTEAVVKHLRRHQPVVSELGAAFALVFALAVSIAEAGPERIVLPVERAGDTVADNFLEMRSRLRAAQRENPGKVMELRSFDAPEAVVAEMRRFADGTNVVWGDIIMELPATRVMQSGGGGTRPPGWWEDRLARNRAQIAASGGRIDVVLLGDSITHFWEMRGGAAYAEITNRYSVLNCGYGGDGVRHLIWRELNGELDGYEAKYAVMMIGTNDRGDPSEIARSVKKALDILLKKQPHAKVLLFAVFPRGRTPADAGRRRNAEVNALLKGLADSQRVVWIDIWDKFLAGDGSLPESLFPDELHPSSAGYAIWQKAIMPYLEGRP